MERDSMKNQTSIFLLGCRGAGKTSFLTGLTLLARADMDNYVFLTAEDKTITLIDGLRRLTDNNKWPPATSTTDIFEFELTYKNSAFNIFFMDYPGEDIEDAIRSVDSSLQKNIQKHAINADFLLVVVDPTQDLRTEVTSVEEKDIRSRRDALLHSIGHLEKLRKQSNKKPFDIAIIISKADLLPGLRSSAKIQSSYTGIWGVFYNIILKKIFGIHSEKDDQLSSDAQHIKQNDEFFKKIIGYAKSKEAVEIFPISVCGYNTEDMSVIDSADKKPKKDRTEDVDQKGTESSSTKKEKRFPSNPKPTGYEKLFEWMQERNLLKKSKPLFIVFLILLIALTASIVGYSFFTYYRTAAFLSFLEEAPIEDISTVLTQKDISRKNKYLRALDGRISREIEVIERQLSLASTDETHKRLEERISLLASVPQIAYSRHLQELHNKVENLREASLFASINAVVRTGDHQSSISLIAEYRKNFPYGSNIRAVENMEQRITDGRRAALRGQIHSILVNNQAGLAKKVGEIRKYLSVYPDDPNTEEIHAAFYVADLLSSADAVRLLVSGSGFSETSAGNLRYEIRWTTGHTEESSLLFRQDTAASISLFAEFMEISNRDWGLIKVELWNIRRGLRDRLMASDDFNIIRDAHLFNGGKRVPLKTNLSQWEEVNAWIRVQLQVRGTGGWQSITRDHLEAYGRFIIPGDEWK